MSGNLVIKKSEMDEHMENFAIGSIVKALAKHSTGAAARVDVIAAMERVYGGHGVWACLIGDDVVTAGGPIKFEFRAAYNGKEISLCML